MRRTVVLALFLAACSGEITGLGEDDELPPPRPDGGTATALAILEPAPGEEVPRDHLLGDGAWAARVRFSAAAPGAARVEWLAGGEPLGEGLPPDYAATAALREEGEREIEAIARDDAGRELARAEVSVRVMPSTAGPTCLEKLDALGVEYSVGPERQGVARPVTVSLPLNGIGYRNSAGNSRATHFMDCELALALWRTAELWKARGVTTVIDYGIYNYRCINQSIPPPCTGTSFSQHAFAMAIDIAVLITGDGLRYVVDDDWIIEDPPAGENTCTVDPVPGEKNVFLHRTLCELYDLDVFKILLTPNYNAAHRNHFHVDLTRQQGNFVGKLAGSLLDGGPVDE